MQTGEALNLRTLAEERGAWIAKLAFDRRRRACPAVRDADDRLATRPATASSWTAAPTRRGSRAARQTQILKRQ